MVKYCKNCKHLGLDGMFGLICEVSGNNKNHDCPKYEEEVEVKMTEKRFTKYTPDTCGYTNSIVIEDHVKGKKSADIDDIVDLLNEQHETIEKQKKIIEEDEKLLKSTYEELTKLRCIKKNISRIKNQWDWIMKAVQYD